MVNKLINKSLYTQAEYSRLKGISRARVNQMVKAGEVSTLTINGAVLIKLN